MCAGSRREESLCRISPKLVIPTGAASIFRRSFSERWPRSGGICCFFLPLFLSSPPPCLPPIPSAKTNSSMSFDPELVEAQLALNRIGTTDMPKLVYPEPRRAWDALEAGLDGPATRRLAALHFPTFFQVREILPKVLEEWHLKQIPKAEAALRLAKRRAREILQSNEDPLKHTSDFSQLWSESDYCAELGEYGPLDEEVYVARYCGRTEHEIRARLLEKLKALANS
jgi:hypothetical protein